MGHLGPQACEFWVARVHVVKYRRGLACTKTSPDESQTWVYVTLLNVSCAVSVYCSRQNHYKFSSGQGRRLKHSNVESR